MTTVKISGETVYTHHLARRVQRMGPDQNDLTMEQKVWKAFLDMAAARLTPRATWETRPYSASRDGGRIFYDVQYLGPCDPSSGTRPGLGTARVYRDYTETSAAAEAVNAWLARAAG